MGLASLKERLNNKEKSTNSTTFEKFDYKTKWFKPTKKSHRVRVVGNIYNSEDPIPEFEEHNGNTFKPVLQSVFGPKVTMANLLTRKFYGEEVDPIIEVLKELYNSGDPKKKELAKQLYTSKVYYVFLVDRDNEADGIKLWKLSKPKLNMLLSVMNEGNPDLNEDDGDIIVGEDFYDNEKGNDLILEFTETENTFRKGSYYWEFTKVTPKKAKKGFTDEQWEVLEKTYYNPEKLYFNTTADKLLALVEAWMKHTGLFDESDEETEEDHEEETSDPIAVDEPKPVAKPVAKVVEEKKPAVKATTKQAPEIKINETQKSKLTDLFNSTEIDDDLPF